MNKKVLGVIFALTLLFSFYGCKNDSPLNIKNLSKYNISINLDTTNYTLDCSQEVKVYNSSKDELQELKFHLYPRAFTVGAINPAVGLLHVDKAYPNGASYGDIEIITCSDNSGEVGFYQEGSDKDILVLPLKESLKGNAYTTVSITYSVKLPNINHRFGYGNNTINIGNFYPVLCVYENGEFSTKPYSTNGDPFYSEMSSYEVDITYPSNYILASTGEVKKNTDEGLNRTTYIEAEDVRDFALILSNKFNTLTKKVGDTTINYYYYNDTQSESSLKACEDSLKTFNDMFGKYPYKVLNVAEANFVYGGMEFPNLVFISDDISTYSDYINTIVHEIAHQWWYGLVGNDEYSYGWLDEGLTEYSTALFYEENPDYNITLKEMIKNTTSSYLLFIEVYSDVFGNVDTTMTRTLDEYDTEPEYVYIAYVKGMLLFNDIRELIGKEDFLKGLKLYVKTYQGKNVVPTNFIDCMEKASSKPLKDVFNSYIDGKVIIMANE